HELHRVLHWLSRCGQRRRLFTRAYSAVAGPVFTINRALLAWTAPSNVDNQISTRTEKLRRIAMTIETPLHLQRAVLIHQRHLVHRSMAGSAANTFVHVDFVVEINIVRQ